MESEFHEYVRPTINPNLSEYCIELTGIQQDLINRQDTFPAAFEKFKAWIIERKELHGLKFATPMVRNTDYGCNAAFCSWTNYDLNHFIRVDFKRHGINPPNEFRAWVDARKVFENLVSFKMRIFQVVSFRDV